MTGRKRGANQGPLSLNRADCSPGEVAGHSEMVSKIEHMEAIHLKDYVKSIDEITTALIPKPTFSAFLAASQKSPTEPLIHVKITHTAINHVDLLYAQGRHQNNHSGLFTPPFTLGLEFSGLVLGTNLGNTSRSSSNARSRFQPGDRVWGGGLGSHACEIIVPESAVRHVPSGWSLHDIAGLGAATAPVSYGALANIANLQQGETILIHAAAGGLGVTAVQIAHALGARVIATVGSEAKAKVIRDLLTNQNTGKIPEGEGVINYSSDREWHKTVLSLTSSSSSSTKSTIGPGVDVVYDTVGLVAQSIRCTRFNGRIVIAGFAGRTGLGSTPDAELENIPMNRVLLKQIKLFGYRYGESGRRMPSETGRIWQGLNAMLEQNEIRPVIYRTYKGLATVKEGMKALGRREVYGKAVVEVCGEEEARIQVLEQIQRGTKSDQAIDLTAKM